MEFFTTKLPLWISLFFLMAIIVPIFWIAKLGKSGVMAALQNHDLAQRLYYGILSFCLLYLFYVTIAFSKGLFATVSLPPRIMVLTAIPLLIFLLGLILNIPITKKILAALPLSKLIRLHLFRLIGSFFLVLAFWDLLPKTFALCAGLGDITIALTSLWVARGVANGAKKSRFWSWLWNGLGLFDILLTSFLAFWFTKQNIELGTQGVDILTEFPFCFIPAFAPATIIFLHACIFKKLAFLD